MKSITTVPFLTPLIVVIWVAAIIFVLVTQKIIFVPLVLGLLFAFFILPAVRNLEKNHFPRILAILLMIILSIAIVAGVGTLLSFAASQFVASIPEYREVIVNNTLAAQKFIQNVAHIPIKTQSAWLAEHVNIFELGANNIGSIATGVGSIISTLGLTFIYTFFILYYRNKVMTFLKKLLGQVEETAILETFRKLTRIVPRYLSGVFWVMLILAVINSIGFWAIGVPNPIFFGIFAAILNIIPYAGPFIAFIIVAAFSFVAVGPIVALGVLILSLIVQFLDNNLLTPNISGGNININPFTAIVGIIIGGSMWGIIGMIVALPVLGMIKVIADSIPKLAPYGYLIGDEGTEEHALSWRNIKRVFKK